MPAISETIINSTSHTLLTSDPISLVGEKFKGDGFYGRGDGIHTVQFELTNFIGDIAIEGSLANTPSDTDWVTIPVGTGDRYSVDTTGLVSKIPALKILSYYTSTTTVKTYNFVGNFVWIRANISNWTHGTINRILLNH
jgi:hypothetical protein